MIATACGKRVWEYGRQVLKLSAQFKFKFKLCTRAYPCCRDSNDGLCVLPRARALRYDIQRRTLVAAQLRHNVGAYLCVTLAACTRF